MPFTKFAANQAWLELVLAAAVCWPGCASAASTANWSRAETKTLRYRLLHVAGRVIRRSRRVILRLPLHWPWAGELADAYRRVALLSA